MKIKTHLRFMIISCLAGATIGSILGTKFGNTELAEEYPTYVLMFVSIHIGWIIPFLFFKFIVKPECPICHSKGKYVARRRSFHKFVCPRCNHNEEATGLY